jgi:hypothetical protein
MRFDPERAAQITERAAVFVVGMRGDGERANSSLRDEQLIADQVQTALERNRFFRAQRQ